MDEAAARRVLVAVEREAGGGAILWRGAGLDGSDVDLLVLPEAEARVNSALAGAGLTPSLSDPGHVMWSGDAPTC